MAGFFDDIVHALFGGGDNHPAPHKAAPAKNSTPNRPPLVPQWTQLAPAAARPAPAAQNSQRFGGGGGSFDRAPARSAAALPARSAAALPARSALAAPQHGDGGWHAVEPQQSQSLFGGGNLPKRVNPQLTQQARDAGYVGGDGGTGLFQAADDKSMQDDVANMHRVRDVTTHELTADQFNALNPRQRAAVEYNTQLVNAAKDGTGKATGAFMQDLGITPVKFGHGFGSVDDYLHLQSAISDDDLNTIEAALPSGKLTGNAKTVNSTVGKMLPMLAQGKYNTVGGGVQPQGQQLDDFKNTYEALMQSGATGQLDDGSGKPIAVTKQELPQVFNGYLQQAGYNPNDFWNYVQNRLSQHDFSAVTNPDQPLGINPDAQYMSRNDVRDVLGF